ncbi:MAG: DNA primase [Caldicoprobacterales bacterium]|jgi:DNA primase|nr:DNA primase [Clostridiales bacterium]
MPNYLPEDFIEEVRVANEITDVLSEYLTLKPKGKNYFGLCPFHNEKTPSFSVDPEKQLYHCFGCGAGGNVFTFIMDQERLDFIDSVKFLAQRKGIPLPGSIESPQDEETRKHKEQLYRLNREAALYYHENLLSHHGRHALEYLKSRGIDQRIIKTFGIGYAPRSWDSTKNYLLSKGFDKQLLTETGLILEKNQREYDRFRDRIMFPIIDHRDRVVGFGGRVLDDSAPKYLNSPESPIFNKGSVLFGLNLARKRRPIESFIIVEGYLDVITLHRFGIYNGVASLGTALTPDQARLMRRYAQNIYTAYDGDTAGQKATLRGLDILKSVGCNVRVIVFPKGMDPDDILVNHGIEYFNKLMNNAMTITDFKLDRLQAQYDLDNQEEKVEFTTKAVRILTDVDNLLERDIYIQRLNNLTGFRPELLYRYVEQVENRGGKPGLKKNKIGNNRHTTPIRKARIHIAANIKAEMHLIRLMASDEEMAKRIINRLGDLRFDDPIHNKVADIIKELIARDVGLNPAQVLNYVQDDKLRGKITEIFEIEMEYDNVDRYIDDCIGELRRSQLEKRRNYLMEQISRMDEMQEHNSIEYKNLVEELSAINRMTKLDPFGKEEVM